MMNKLILIFSFTFMTGYSFGQDLGDFWYDLNFEDTASIKHLHIDSILNQNHLWQVGIPRKSIFNAAHNSANAILTNTSTFYPTNDTSIFTIINIANGGGWYIGHTVIFAGYYQVNSDTLTDFGSIEISPDNGKTWIDLIHDTKYSSSYHWYTEKPVLTGNSNGWKFFHMWLAGLGPLFHVAFNDTILYRFTFISDSIETNKEGLMFDDFHFEDWAEGIPEIQNNDYITVFPNPATNEIKICRSQENKNAEVQILNAEGRMIYENKKFQDETIDLRKFTNGIYFLKYFDGNNFYMKKFTLQR